MNSETVRLFAFSSGWGIPFPTGAPFPLKLATWMRMAGIDFEWRIEDNTAKGPKGKSPWIEHGDVRMGDSSLIIEYLADEFGVRDFDAGLTPEQRAMSTAVQRMLEEHYHQCYEHQLFFGRGSAERMAEIAAALPPVVNMIVPAMLRRHFAKQLHARGMARHSEDVIIAQGRADIDTLVELLGGTTYFHGDEPTAIDACIFGFLGVTVYVEGDNPLFDYAASRPTLMAYCERMRSKYFPESVEKLALLDGPVGNVERAAA